MCLDHEAIKTSIPRLLEAWALLTRTRLLGVGLAQDPDQMDAIERLRRILES